MAVELKASAQEDRLRQAVRLGTAGSTGGQYMRRPTGTFDKQNGHLQSNEIVNHQQSTGATEGVADLAASWTACCRPAPTRCSSRLAAAQGLRGGHRDHAASLTIAGSGPTYTITRAAGSWLTDGVKKGMVGRLHGRYLQRGEHLQEPARWASAPPL
jgi:hypothetical protein